MGHVSKGVPQAVIDALPRSQYRLPSTGASAGSPAVPELEQEQCVHAFLTMQQCLSDTVIAMAGSRHDSFARMGYRISA